MMIKLPAPDTKGDMPIEEAIAKRRSERKYAEKALTIRQISQLLWACQGITDDGRGFRSAPSAGATYPLEVYLINADGSFQYIPGTHSLKRLRQGDMRGDLSRACYGQRFVKDAACDIVICADFKRTTASYGDRGEGYVYIEVGHAAENVHLQAVALGLGSVPVGAFSNDQVSDVLSIPENFVPLYVIPVGYVKE